jgi:hypothetical protein
VATGILIFVTTLVTLISPQVRLLETALPDYEALVEF